MPLQQQQQQRKNEGMYGSVKQTLFLKPRKRAEPQRQQPLDVLEQWFSTGVPWSGPRGAA